MVDISWRSSREYLRCTCAHLCSNAACVNPRERARMRSTRSNSRQYPSPLRPQSYSRGSNCWLLRVAFTWGRGRNRGSLREQHRLSSFTDPGGTITGGLITRRCSMVTHLMQRFLEQESAEHAPTHSLRSDMEIKSTIRGPPKVFKEEDARSHAMQPCWTSMSHRPNCTLLRAVGLPV